MKRFFVASLFFAFFVASAFAGPPLVCHSFDIGNAKSIPWISHSWNLTGAESYDTKNLSTDTLAILDSDPTVLVHMETLRRAALYGQKDPIALKQLLVRLVARSDSAPANAAALASFDLGYFAETLGQAQFLNKSAGNPAQGIDGYALVRKALRLGPDDAQMQFAAALITLDGPASDHQQYAQDAMTGAKSDPLLARNLSSHFIGPQSETMAELLSHNFNVKVAHP
jgi:hypothetical protein